MTKYIGITGSVGKSTTIGILSVLLRNRGFSVHEVHKQDEIKVGLEKADVDFVLIKFSPFVLENFKDLSLDISAILNIRTELKDKDISESNFVKLFGQIYNNTKEFCIFNARDRSTDRLVQDADVVEGARAIGFTRSTPSRGQIGLVEGIVVDRAFYDDPTDPLRFLNATEILNLKDYKNLLNAVDVLPDYLVENVVAAITIARSLGVSVESISGSLHQFILNNTQNHLAYRRDLSVEPQYLSGAVNYVNDLNSQNPVSTLEVLKSYRKNSVILVLAGDTKGLDYSWFVKEAKEYLLAAVVVGSHNHPLYELIKTSATTIPVYLVDETAELKWVDAVIEQANKLFYGNDIVLFSPAANLKPLGDVQEISENFIAKLSELKAKVHGTVILGLTK